jgi:hypothetical protein
LKCYDDVINPIVYSQLLDEVSEYDQSHPPEPEVIEAKDDKPKDLETKDIKPKDQKKKPTDGEKTSMAPYLDIFKKFVEKLPKGIDFDLFFTYKNCASNIYL